MKIIEALIVFLAYINTSPGCLNLGYNFSNHSVGRHWQNDMAKSFQNLSADTITTI